MEWKYSERGNYWCASRPMEDGSNCDFIYCIFPLSDGTFFAEAENNGYGAYRVAVKNKNCIRASSFNDLGKLKKDIENRNILWLYTGGCNCIGEITKEER